VKFRNYKKKLRSNLIKLIKIHFISLISPIIFLKSLKATLMLAQIRLILMKDKHLWKIYLFIKIQFIEWLTRQSSNLPFWQVYDRQTVSEVNRLFCLSWNAFFLCAVFFEVFEQKLKKVFHRVELVPLLPLAQIFVFEILLAIVLNIT